MAKKKSNNNIALVYLFLLFFNLVNIRTSVSEQTVCQKALVAMYVPHFNREIKTQK